MTYYSDLPARHTGATAAQCYRSNRPLLKIGFKAQFLNTLNTAKMAKNLRLNRSWAYGKTYYYYSTKET